MLSIKSGDVKRHKCVAMAQQRRPDSDLKISKLLFAHEEALFGHFGLNDVLNERWMMKKNKKCDNCKIVQVLALFFTCLCG